jgi:hypothetical protein
MASVRRGGFLNADGWGDARGFTEGEKRAFEEATAASAI